MLLQQKFSYTNGTATELRITVEPWAEQFVVNPGQRVEISVYGEGALDFEEVADLLEFEQVSTGLIVYGQVGCVISLSVDGKEMVPSPQG